MFDSFILESNIYPLMNILDMNNRELELFCAVLLVIYGINFWVGKRENYRLANAWLDLVRQVLADNFGKIGTISSVKNEKDVKFE